MWNEHELLFMDYDINDDPAWGVLGNKLTDESYGIIGMVYPFLGVTEYFRPMET